MSSGVEFDEDKIIYSRPLRSSSAQAGSGLEAWLIRKGYARSGGGAKAIMVGVIIINIIIIFFILRFLI